MNVEQSMCASSEPATGWDRLEWSHHERQVRRLQARIVKATREGRWGKALALQRLLIRNPLLKPAPHARGFESA